MNFVPSGSTSDSLMLSGLDIREETLMTFKTAVKVYTLSDLHVDMKGNLEWVAQHCRPGEKDDCYFTVLIIAGDMSASLDYVKRAFDILVGSYDAVCFVPGNHDVWKRGDVPGDNSVRKLQALLALAGACDVHMGPVHIYSSESAKVILDIYPLYSWYHSSWDVEPDMIDQASIDKELECPFSLKWSDFRRCAWPNNSVQGMDFVNSDKNAPNLSRLFAQLNEPFILKADTAREKESSLQKLKGIESSLIAETDISKVESKTPVITFSHFLPRQECCPEKRFLNEQHLMKVIGTNDLDRQARALLSDLHIFGHTHIPIDITLDGLRYIQWPLGYLREAETACAPVRRLQGPLLVYVTARQAGAADERESDNVSGVPIDVPSYHAFWSGYYRHERRMPDSTGGISPELTRSLIAASLVASSNTNMSCPCCCNNEECGREHTTVSMS